MFVGGGEQPKQELGLVMGTGDGMGLPGARLSPRANEDRSGYGATVRFVASPVDSSQAAAGWRRPAHAGAVDRGTDRIWRGQDFHDVMADSRDDRPGFAECLTSSTIRHELTDCEPV